MDQSLVVPSLAVTPRLLRELCGDATLEQIWALPKPANGTITTCSASGPRTGQRSTASTCSTG